MIKLSAVVSVFNEEKKIEECLKSLSFADEIIVIDNSSTDKTKKIALKHTKNVYSQKNNPEEIDLQKNFGFKKANGEWILSVDADERVGKELAEEIKEAVSKNTDVIAYWISRKNYIFGKWIKHTGWYPDHQLRLFRKGKGEFVKKVVHQTLQVSGKTDFLKNDLIHKNYDTLDQFIYKTISLYAPSEAEQKIKGGYVFSPLDALRFPFNEFISRYFARKGYKDGLHGLTLSLLMAFYHFMVFCNIWQKKGFKEEEVNFKNLRNEIEAERKDTNYWINKEEKNQTRNPFRKLQLQIKQKIS